MEIYSHMSNSNKITVIRWRLFIVRVFLVLDFTVVSIRRKNVLNSGRSFCIVVLLVDLNIFPLQFFFILSNRRFDFYEFNCFLTNLH